MTGSFQQQVLIVGAGPAGISTACALAGKGIASVIVDLAALPGGAIYRQPLQGVQLPPGIQSTGAQWRALIDEFERNREFCTFWPATGFAGIDHTGLVQLSGQHAGIFRPRALILATGAREIVRPRPGWTLPGVRTAGSIQIALKTTGLPPAGRILLAGSGPLLFAVGAQLAAARTPPIAIIQAGKPFARPWAAFSLHAGYYREASHFLLSLIRHRVPILSAASLDAVAAGGDGLIASITAPGGKTRRFTADIVGLHDGLECNDPPAPEALPIPLLRVGDCREALGARAAIIDGRHGGNWIAALLVEGAVQPTAATDLARERRAQVALARMFNETRAPSLTDLPNETIICRCENRSVADLGALGDAPADRDLRLVGRFGMGACQGRGCARWVRALTGAISVPLRLGAARLPARPIAVADLLASEARAGEPSAAQPDMKGTSDT